MVAIFENSNDAVTTKTAASKQVEEKTIKQVKSEIEKIKGDLVSAAETGATRGTYFSAAQKADRVAACVDSVMDQVGADLPLSVKERLSAHLKDVISNGLRADHADTSYSGGKKGNIELSPNAATRRGTQPLSNSASEGNSLANGAFADNANPIPAGIFERNGQSNSLTVGQAGANARADQNPSFNKIKQAITNEIAEGLKAPLAHIKELLDPLRGQQGVLNRNEIPEAPKVFDRARMERKPEVGAPLVRSYETQIGSFHSFLSDLAKTQQSQNN